MGEGEHSCKLVLFWISNFRCVLNVAFFILGDFPASEFYVLMFRNTLCQFHLHMSCGRPMKMEPTGCSETSAHKIQTPENHPKERTQQIRFDLTLRDLFPERKYLHLHMQYLYKITWFLTIPCRPGSSVGIATGYGLDGPGIESRWGRDFPHLSRPALEPTQPPV